MNLKNKVVLVTGASSGIGQAIAIEFAKAESVVLINYRKNKKGAQETLKEVEKHSSGGIFQADLSIEEQVSKMYASISKEYKNIDILVNNAGDAGPGEIDDMEMWDYQWKNTFLSCVITASEFLKMSKPKELRKIINISSVYGLFNSADTNFMQYSAAKAAMNSFTVSIAKKLGPDVLVNAIAPGYTWTPAWEEISKKDEEQCKNETIIKRYIEPEEIAEVVLMLGRSDAMTGAIVVVDGGLTLK